MRLSGVAAGLGTLDANMEKLATLQDDEDYLVEKFRDDGVLVVRKSVKRTTDERRKATFLNELQGTERFVQLADAHPEWRLKVPRIIARDATWVIREFVDGDELMERTISVQESKVRLGQLAAVLAAIDKISPQETKVWEQDSAPYTDIRRRFDVWSKSPLEARVLDVSAYEAANQLIEEYSSILEPRYAHGDMSPFKHVFVTPKDTLAFIYFEHYSPMKPRYYDVAYAYSRLRMQADLPEVAGVFLREFLRVAESVPNQKEQLLAIMTQRAIGMHFDALNDYKKGSDYRRRAQDFLTVCLERDVDRLIEAPGLV